MATQTLIIGYGSRLRGDDALGPIAAERLEQRLDPQTVKVVEAPSLTPDLAADLAEADRVVFIDASVEGSPGEITATPVRTVGVRSAAMVHFLDPPALLAWAHELYGKRPEAVLYTVAGSSFGVGEDLSEAAARALEELIERICRYIDQGDAIHA